MTADGVVRVRFLRGGRNPAAGAWAPSLPDSDRRAMYIANSRESLPTAR